MTQAEHLAPDQLILNSLRRFSLLNVNRSAVGIWNFDFGNANLSVECPWRLVDTHSIVLSGSDHNHKFGLTEPVNIESETIRLLGGKLVETV